jgi:RNA-directed DNA polymerase
METSKQATEANAVTEEERARWARRLKWEWAETSIWTDAMLTALEIGVKGRKWFSLIDKAYRKGTLEAAWQKVRANNGAAGIDKITIGKFESNQVEYLQELEHELKTGTYLPIAVKRVYIPKGQGKMRPLGLPSIKDKIAQQAVKMVLEPIFEKEFLDMSFGFRPRRGAQMALAEVDRLNKEGYIWVFRCRFTDFFRRYTT